MRKVITNTGVLNQAWKLTQKEFGIPRIKSSKIEYVAVRAAYCLEMYNTKMFSLHEVGASMSMCKKIKGKEVPYNLDHSLVIHLKKKAEWGTYNHVPSYASAREFVRDFISANLLQINTFTESPSNEAIVIDNLNMRVRDLIKERDKALKQRDGLAARIHDARSIDVQDIINHIDNSNLVYESLGYKIVPTYKLKLLASKLKTLDLIS